MIWLLACGSDPPDPPDTTPPPPPTSVPTETYAAAPGSLVLSGVMALDAQGARGPVSIVIGPDHLVAAVLDEPVVVEGAEEIPVSAGSWVVPGLVDPHVHLFLSGTAAWVGDPLPTSLRATVTHGVTTVVDAGSPTAAFALRERIRAGELLGPDVFALGPMVTALGSHPCETVYDPDWCTFVATEDEVLAAKAARADGDGVKLAIADASFTPWPTPRIAPELAELAVILDKYAVAHVDEDEDVRIALDAGVGQLAHPVFGGSLLDETVADLALSGAAVHTTLGAFAGTLELLDGTLPLDIAGGDPRVAAAWQVVRDNPELVDPQWVEGSAAWLESAEASLLALDAAGIPLLPASDAGYLYVPHGLGLHLELQRLAALGFDPERLIVAATAGNAAALGLADRGALAPGLRADLVVVAGDPRADLALLARPTRVVLNGAPLDDPASADVLLVRATSDEGEFCLDERDCTTGGCDLVRHACAEPCGPAGDPTELCGPDSVCTYADEVSMSPVCRPRRTCDLYDPTTCAPPPYEERCAPLDLDTNGCFPAGPRQDGQPCDPFVTAETCAPGLICTLDDLRCHAPCGVGHDCGPGQDCVAVQIAGEPWFGTCR